MLAPMTSSWERVQQAADVSHDRFALFLGDARARLRDLPAGSVHTCLTSPPYWSARDYEHPSQIGQEPAVEEYVQNLVDVFSVVRHALRNAKRLGR